MKSRLRPEAFFDIFRWCEQKHVLPPCCGIDGRQCGKPPPPLRPQPPSTCPPRDASQTRGGSRPGVRRPGRCWVMLPTFSARSGAKRHCSRPQRAARSRGRNAPLIQGCHAHLIPKTSPPLVVRRTGGHPHQQNLDGTGAVITDPQNSGPPGPVVY